MNLKSAIKQVNESIAGKQDPDKVVFTKQWDEFARLKGWLVRCTWEGKGMRQKSINFDITPYYNRIIGDLDKIPDFIPGKHQQV